MKLCKFKVLSLDVYGTLIDWEKGILSSLKPLTDQMRQKLSSDHILEAHAYHESELQRWAPSTRYSELLAVVYKRLAEEWGVDVSFHECQAYGLSVGHWPAFDDSVEALRYLKKHFKIVVLSNIDNESFHGSSPKLGISFDAVYTAQDIGSYKPSNRNFKYMLKMLERSGVQKTDILHVAESMFHDHAPANKNGISNCRIFRRYDKKGFGATMDPGQMPTYNFVFHSLYDLVRAHKAEINMLSISKT